MNILFHLAISVLCTFVVPEQPVAGTMSGEWFGYITQTPAGLAAKYDFSLNIKRGEDDISGSSTIRMIDEPEYFGLMNLNGTITEKHIELTEFEITEQNLFFLAYWCKKTLILDYKREGEKEILSGHWESEDCSSSEGEIYLERVAI